MPIAFRLAAGLLSYILACKVAVVEKRQPIYRSFEGIRECIGSIELQYSDSTSPKFAWPWYGTVSET